MLKLYENVHIFNFQKGIVSVKYGSWFFGELKVCISESYLMGFSLAKLDGVDDFGLEWNATYNFVKLLSLRQKKISSIQKSNYYQKSWIDFMFMLDFGIAEVISNHSWFFSQRFL